MQSLSDKLLLDSYIKSLELKLDEEFVNLLEKELTRREWIFSEKRNNFNISNTI